MSTPLKSSEFIKHAKAGLAAICRARNAHLCVAVHLRAALDAMFDGPGGSVVTLIPGGETPDGGEGGELQVLDKGISLIISHRLPPTAAANQALYDTVGGVEPFLDLIDALRDAMRELDMPAGSTGGYWRYTGMAAVEFSGIPMPAFKLDFQIDAAPTDARGLHVEIEGEN
jgi:hypothetical protein